MNEQESSRINELRSRREEILNKLKSPELNQAFFAGGLHEYTEEGANAGLEQKRKRNELNKELQEINKIIGAE